MANDRTVADDDVRHDDLEFNPSVAPKPALAWINLLKESEVAFERWNQHCDNIDQLYASLERLTVNARDKQYQMFWANCEVLKPSIYARPPVPVVVPKFKDRRPTYQASSEVLERCVTVAFDLTTINEPLMLVRDDVALIGRGTPWCRYEGKQEGNGYYGSERVCVDFKHRRDFLHSLSRCWYEVTWVAAASYLTRDEARDRFKPHSGFCYQDAEYKIDKEAEAVGGSDRRERAKFWEIWDKTSRRVYWVAEGCDEILDEGEPHLDLQNYFPCPKPAYGTLQRGSLVPVPDALQYKDQLDEINSLTSRIHSLSDAIEVKGFYPSGTSELAEAVEAAVKMKAPGRILVPIKEWAAFGGSKEIVVWLPIDMIAQVVTLLVAQRKEIINDIYQITGLSDIMRGETDARETLGAQELKTEFGSSRVRDRQLEMQRVARDLVCITCEIMCEKFSDETIIEMSQSQLPTDGILQQQAQMKWRDMQQQWQTIQQAANSPQGQQMKQQNPDQAKQLEQQAREHMEALQKEVQAITEEPTIDKVLKFLRDNRARSFVLDIETDSTVLANENAEKKQRTEFTSVIGDLLNSMLQMIALEPASSELCGDILKFAVAPFRAGRALDGSIDKFIDAMDAKSSQPKGDDPATAQNKIALQIEQIKNDRAKQRDQADIALKAKELNDRHQIETAKLLSNSRIEMAKLQGKQQDDAAKANQTNAKVMAERESHQMDLIGKQHDIQLAREKADMARQTALARQGEMAARAGAQRVQQQMRQPQGRPQGYFTP